MPQIYQIHWYDERSSYTSDFMIYPLTGLPLSQAAELARSVKLDIEATPGMAGAELKMKGTTARGRAFWLG